MEWFIFEVPVPLFKNYRSAVADLELDAATAERVITPIDQFDTYPRDAAPWLYRQKGHSHFSESGHRLATEALLEGMFDKTPMSSNVAGPDLAFPGFWRAVLPTSALPSTRQPAPMYIAWHD